jgi:hypothetical protein
MIRFIIFTIDIHIRLLTATLLPIDCYAAFAIAFSLIIDYYYQMMIFIIADYFHHYISFFAEQPAMPPRRAYASHF